MRFLTQIRTLLQFGLLQKLLQQTKCFKFKFNMNSSSFQIQIFLPNSYQAKDTNIFYEYLLQHIIISFEIHTKHVHKQMQQQTKIKIEQIEPSCTNFHLYFQIAQIISRNSGKLECRLVDDTGIVNAYFDKYADKLDKGGVFLMTNMKCTLVNGHIRVQMSQNTVASKEPDVMGFKDKANDISKKIHTQKVNQNKKVQNEHKNDKKQQIIHKDSNNKGVIQENMRKSQTLIPFSKQQAINQLKLRQKFEQNIKHKHNPKDIQKQQSKQNKQENQHIQYKQKEKEKQLVYKQKHLNYKQKANQIKATQYKEKDNKNVKQNRDKIEYKLKQQTEQQKGRIYKTKSLVYKPKFEQRNGYRQIDEKLQKNEKNRYDDHKGDSQNNNKFKEKQNKNPNYQNNRKQLKNKYSYEANQKSKQTITNQKNQKSQNNTTAQHNKISQSAPEQKPTSKISQKKQHKGQIDIINIPTQAGNCVNLKAWITKKTKPIAQTNEIQKLVADTTGSVWLRCNKINLQSEEVYEIDNLQVCKEQTRFYLKQSEFTQARRIQGTLAFNLRQINTKE